MAAEDQNLEQISILLQETAVSFPYPPTPDIAAKSRGSRGTPARSRPIRLAWTLALLLVALGLLLAVPQVRAAVIQFIRTGAITIFIDEQDQAANSAISVEEPTLPALETVVFENAHLLSLTEAQSQSDFPLLLPSSLDLPDAVYLQVIDNTGQTGEVLIMLWRNPAGEEIILYQIDVPTYGMKSAARESLIHTRFRGVEGFWIEGSHTIGVQIAQEQIATEVTRNVLVWEENGLTYRLESDLSLDEAQGIAESLR